jgi:endonuclease/exonuclease/phosphatase family metal-dependent hydrolase
MTKLRKPWWPVAVTGLGILGVFGAELAVRLSPSIWSSLAIAGTAFPITWMCLTLGTASSLLFRRWRLFRWGFLFILLSAPHAAQTWGWTFYPENVGGESPPWSFSPGASSVFQKGGNGQGDDIQFQALSWNVRQFDRLGWLNNANAREEMLALLGSEAPDLVCLQECFLEDNAAPWMTQKRLQRASGLTYWAQAFKLGSGHEKFFGLAVLSRFPILDVKAIEFPNDKNNSAMYADLLIGKDTIRAFNVHLSSIHFEQEDYQAMRQGPDESERLRLLDRLETAWQKRALQAELVAEHVANSPYAVVLMGDFNDGPVSYAKQQFQPYLQDAYNGNGPLLGATYAGDIPGMRIDFILHSPVLEPVEFETSEVMLSDHRPIQALFKWRSGIQSE